MKFVLGIVVTALALLSQTTVAYYYLYVSAGPRNRTSDDFVATFSINPTTLDVSFQGFTFLGTHNNEPHHIYTDVHSRQAVLGGLLSFLNLGNQADTYFFNLTNPAQPQLISSKSDHVGIATAADAGEALSNGGFLVTMMGGPGGGVGGSVIEYDRYMNRRPGSLQPTDGTVSQFNPHGISATQDSRDDFFITTDFLVPASTIGGPIQAWSTARVWKLSTRTFLKTIDLAGGNKSLGGVLDVAFLHADRGAIASAVGTGELYYIDPVLYTSTLAYTLPAGAHPHIVVASKSTRRVFVSAAGSNTVYLFDTTNPKSLQLLASATVGIGPHFMFLDHQERFLVVSYYFLDESSIPGGLVDQPGDQVIRFFKLNHAMTTLTHVSSSDVDMTKPPFQANPHGMAAVHNHLHQTNY